MGPILNGYEVTDLDRALQVTLGDIEPDGTRTVSRSCKSHLALFTVDRQRALRPTVAFSETCLPFRHRASSIQDRHFATLQRTLFIYLINKYISLSDICLTVHH